MLVLLVLVVVVLVAMVVEVVVIRVVVIVFDLSYHPISAAPHQGDRQRCPLRSSGFCSQASGLLTNE